MEIEAPVPGLKRDARGNATLRILGIDPLRAVALAPALLGKPAVAGDARYALLGDGLYLSPAALQRLGVAPGGLLTVQSGAGTVHMPIVGTLPGARAGEELGVMDIAAAQQAFAQSGRLQRIDVRLVRNASAAAARERIAALLPAGVTIATPDETAQRVSNVSRAYRVNLNVLALVALFTGAFLVYSLQAQAVVARRTELAFLRVAGVTPRELQRLLVWEAALIGALGSVVGLVLGGALAALALSYLGGDLGSGMFAGTRAALRFDPAWTLTFFVLGVRRPSPAAGCRHVRRACRRHLP